MTEKFCIIKGKRYRVGDVVLDFTGKSAPTVSVHLAEPVAWRWFVVRVNPNCDERAVASLGSKALKVFRPTERVVRCHSGKRVEVEKSLFPRYLFAGLPEDIRGQIDFVTPSKCDGVEGMVRVAGAPAEVREAVITSMQDAQQAGFFDRTRQSHGFEAGWHVKIKDGPFAGFLATIAKADPEKRIEVLIEMFGKPQRLRVTPDQLEVVS